MRYLLAAALLAAPSISNAEVYQSKDKFSGEVTYNTKSRGAHLEGGSFVSMRYVNFQLVVNKSLEKTEKPICIIVMTQTEGWTFIQAGPSMILKLGETEFLTLSGPGSGSGRTAIGGDTVTEVAGWCTSIETAEKMAASKVLQFRILGDQRTLTGSLGANFLSDLTEITNFVKADLAVLPAPTTAAPIPGSPPPTEKIGVTVFPSAAGAIILMVTPGSPASLAGLKAGQVIESANGVPLKGLTFVAENAIFAGLPAAITFTVTGIGDVKISR